MTHDTALCAELGHFISTVHAIYCPHRQAWTIVWRSGDDADDTIYDHGVEDMGPFDGHEDALIRARAIMASAIGVRVRQFLADLDRREDNRPEVDQDEPF